MGCCVTYNTKKKTFFCQDLEGLIKVIEERIYEFNLMISLAIEKKNEGELQALQIVISDLNEITREIKRNKYIDLKKASDSLEEFFLYYDDNRIKGNYREMKGKLLVLLKSNY